MTPLPPFPTFNHEPVEQPPCAAMTEAAAPPDAAASIFIQSSPAPSSDHLFEIEGDREPLSTRPSVMPACGAGEAFRAPAGYVLVERDLLGRLLKRVQQIAARDREQLRERLPTFLTADHLRRHA